MGAVTVHTEMELDDPYFVEGMPGIGLVGKIGIDHIIEKLDMDLYATVDTEGLPRVSLFEQDSRDITSPVRIFGSAEHDLLALRADILISPVYASEFIDVLTDWLIDQNATPILTSGLPSDADTPQVYGIATGAGAAILDDHDIPAPENTGFVSGPTGALLHQANEKDIDAVGLIVDSDPQFPDPDAARILVDEAIEPITGIDVPTESLTEKAAEIREQKEELAQLIREAEEHEASQALPEDMYH